MDRPRAVPHDCRGGPILTDGLQTIIDAADARPHRPEYGWHSCSVWPGMAFPPNDPIVGEPWFCSNCGFPVVLERR